MHSSRASSFVIPALFLLILLTSAATAGRTPTPRHLATTVYVDLDSPGPNHDGSSWDEACLTIQAGIDAAAPGDDVWVADGTYVEKLTAADDVAVYGGFLGAEPGGYETSLGQRDFVTNVTVIDGNAAGSVVTISGLGETTARIDGFTIRNGSATYGGGAYCYNSAPTVANCIFEGNAATNGSGLYAYTGSVVTLTNNTFTNNMTGYPVSLHANNVRGLVTGNSGSGNEAGDVIEIYGGILGVSQTWMPNPLAYRVTQDVQVYEYQGAAVLTLAPGTRVEFANGRGLYVGYSADYHGGLICDGEPGNEIVLTAASPAPGAWKGIYYYDGAIDGQCILDHCIIEHGGAAHYGNITCNDTDATFTNCTITGSSYDGILLARSSATISGCTTSDNGRCGIRVDAGCEGAQITDNIADGNGQYPYSVVPASVPAMRGGNTGSGNTLGDVIEIRGGTVDVSQTWEPDSLVYRATGTVQVLLYEGSPVLTIAAGTTVEFNSNCRLDVGGTASQGGGLVCQGELASPVVLTATSGEAAGWPGVYFADGTLDAQSSLTHTHVEYGGQSYYSNIYCYASSPTIADCTVSGSSHYGIRLGNSSATVTDCLLSDNGYNGLYVENGCADAQITNNIADNNGQYPYSLLATSVPAMRGGNTGSGNVLGDRIEVRAGTVDTSVTWQPDSMPYRVTGAVYIYKSEGAPVLTIAADTTVEFDTYAVLFVGYGATNPGGLVCAGAPGSEVVLTSSSGAPGGWSGIYFYDAAIDEQCTLTECRIEYGGRSYNSNIYCAAAAPTLTNCTVTGSSQDGIILSQSSATVSGCTISDNARYGINADAGSQDAQVTGNTADGNGQYPYSVVPVSVPAMRGGNTGSGNTLGDVIQIRPGTVDVSQTWRPDAIPYRATGTVNVYKYEGAPVLTIDAGTTIEFDSYCGLYVASGSAYPGGLICNGDAGSPVVLTASSGEPGGWYGVYFQDGALDAESNLQYTHVIYAGQSNLGNVRCHQASPTFSNCTFTGSSRYGVRLEYSSATVTDCNLSDNAEYGLYVENSSYDAQIMNNTADSNGKYPYSLFPNSAQAMRGGNVGTGNVLGDVVELRSGTVDTTQTWAPDSLPYRATGALWVYKNAGAPILTIAAGTVIEFNSSCGLNIAYSTGYPGGLVCAGEEGSEVVLTATSGEPGGWSGLVFADATLDAETTLSHTRVEYAGQSNNAAVYIADSAPTLSDCAIVSSSTYGIYLYRGSPTITGCDLSSNAKSGLYADARSSDAQVTNNEANNNGEYAYTVQPRSVPAMRGGNTGTGNAPADVIRIEAGVVDISLVWSPDALPYRATGIVYVYDDENEPVLTVEPGTRVEFDRTILQVGYGATYAGGLACTGEPGNEIVFTSASGAPDGWGGITFYDPTIDGSSSLSHCVVEYGGYTTSGNLTCDAAAPTVTDCTFSGGEDHGIHLLNGSTALIERCLFTGNGKSGIYVGANCPDAQVRNNTSDGNTDYAYLVYPNSVPAMRGGNIGAGNTKGDAIAIEYGIVGVSQTWAPDSLIYRGIGDILVYQYQGLAILTIGPGTEIEFDPSAGLQIGSSATYAGALIVAGAPGAEVLLTATSRTPGGWDGLQFNDGADDGLSIVEHSRIEYGGGASQANVRCNSSGPTIAHCTIAGSSTQGVYVSSGSAVVAGCVLTENNIAVRVDYSTGRLVNNVIIANTESSIGAVCHYYSATVVANNIIAHNESGIRVYATVPPTLLNNCVYGNTAFDYMNTDPGDGDISVDPMLVDWPNGDYHLDPLSPCIEAGSVDGLAETRLYVDTDGEPRICDSDSDSYAIPEIGLDEIVGGTQIYATCPADHFTPGWVWFSIPLPPTGSTDASDVLGFECRNRVYGWDDAMKTFLLYPDDFTDVDVGPSYLARLALGESYVPEYEGTVPTMPFSRTLPAAGWCWIGVPNIRDIHGLDLMVTKGWEVRTPLQDKTSGEPWMNWNWIYWSSGDQNYGIMDPFGGGDDVWLHPWWGYRAWFYTEDVTIVFP